MASHSPSSEDHPLDPPVGLLTVAEAAQQAGVSRYTVSGWIAGGRLPATRIGRRNYVHLADVTAVQSIAHVGRVVPAWRRNRRRAGRRLRALREAAGLSQLALAAASGVPHEIISLLETGRRAPRATTVPKLAQALGVEPQLFVNRKKLPISGLTVAAAAARLEVPPDRVQRWLSEGKLAGVKVSGRWYVPVEVVLALERSERLRGRSRRLDPRFRG
jgi:excisionase family DNA binding protein